MSKVEKILLDYWFEGLDELIETLETWERYDENDNLFFKNAIKVVAKLYHLSAYLE